MQRYKLVWADEFDKPGPPDPKNWKFEHGFQRNEEHQWYQPENAFCEKGMLIIEGRRERVKNPNYKPGSSNWRENREFAEFTSASLKTEGLHAWQFGRFELRARIDTQLGLWPAWWTIGVEGEWPSGGEIDIMEFYRGQLLANLAWGTNKRWSAKWASTHTPLEKLGKDWSKKFHTWRMDWDEKAIVLSVDGNVLNTVALSQTINGDGSGKNPFLQPHYLILNLAVGGQNGGDTTKTSFPTRYEIDYVRVYQATR